ncbi:H-NS family nucleoid-associated regulatory protein [Ideonella sp.]|uniref:H-NS histone family protein n=1 Tax=Ideonella sp. TaxID=1929293 RepID=UPI003BB81689
MPDAELTDLDALFSARPQVLSKRERELVISRIESLMSFWGITLEDLERADASPAHGQAPSQPLPVKYVHPISGETWDGQGPHPEWLRHALLKEGFRVEELRPQVAAPEAGSGD